MESSLCSGDIMERVIPAENIQLMFHYRNPFVEYRSDTVLIKQPRSIISGLSDSFSNVSTDGQAGVVFISFYPAGACHFFKFPLSEIENRSIDMTAISGTKIKQVEECLYFAKTVKHRVSIIEDFLLTNYSPIPLHDNLLIQKGIELIKQSKGQINATVLSNTLSTTPKTLERKFSRYVGKTTKQLINLLRFQGVLQDISINKGFNLTQHAYNNGYFDQSHFIHEFKNFSGYTPREFITKYPDFNINAESC
jgi:AraC-like DNA-binding protein